MLLITLRLIQGKGHHFGGCCCFFLCPSPLPFLPCSPSAPPSLPPFSSRSGTLGPSSPAATHINYSLAWCPRYVTLQWAQRCHSQKQNHTRRGSQRLFYSVRAVRVRVKMSRASGAEHTTVVERREDTKLSYIEKPHEKKSPFHERQPWY